jgi:hypothetical protein
MHGDVQRASMAHDFPAADAAAPAETSASLAWDHPHVGSARGGLARNGDGEPGAETLWRGYRALQRALNALEIAKAVNL